MRNQSSNSGESEVIKLGNNSFEMKRTNASLASEFLNYTSFTELRNLIGEVGLKGNKIVLFLGIEFEILVGSHIYLHIYMYIYIYNISFMCNKYL